MSALVPSPPVNATTTQRGLVSTTVQTINGGKRGNVSMLASIGGETIIDLNRNNFFYLYADEETALQPINTATSVGQSGIIIVVANNSEQPINFTSEWKRPVGDLGPGGPDGTISTISYFVADIEGTPTILACCVRGYI